MKYFNHAIYNKQEFTIDASKKQEKENNKKSKTNINNNINNKEIKKVNFLTDSHRVN